MKKILIAIFFLLLWIWSVYAVYDLTWKNWDANVGTWNSENDKWILSWNIKIEDSKSSDFEDWIRWKITWKVTSDLFWDFNIIDKFLLEEKTWNFEINSECWDNINKTEIYKISWKIRSDFFWEMIIDESNSYFCSNNFAKIKFNSNQLGYKDLWESTQSDLVDNFWKQKISISWIANLKWSTWEEILTRWDSNISTLSASVSNKTLSKKYINKNIARIWKTFSDKIEKNNSTLYNFDWKKYFLYDFSEKEEEINFLGNTYKNKWKILTIWNSDTKVDWKKIVIVKWWNIYIKSNIYNKNDKNSILTIVSKKTSDKTKWWNIYIDPGVTNIDAVLIADGSLISYDGSQLNQIQDVWTYKNNLRKQLLIYGSILSSNRVWTDEKPYWSDYYEDNSYIPSNNDSIYDLSNLRTFNLSYWVSWLNCDDENKLAPIDWKWDFLKNAWAWKRECYIDDSWDSNLRKSNKTNPLIIEYNSNLKNLNPEILQKN